MPRRSKAIGRRIERQRLFTAWGGDFIEPQIPIVRKEPHKRRKPTAYPKIGALFGFTLICACLLFHSFLFAADSVEPRKPGLDERAPSDSTIKVTTCFSPGGGCTEKIVARIARATKSIDLAIYTFTNRKLAGALIRAHKRGVKIRILTDDETMKNKHSRISSLANAGISVRIDEPKRLMHNKFAVFDGQCVVTGSFNWTWSAETYNDENLLFIESSQLSKEYTVVFYRIWKRCKPLKGGKR